MARFVLSNTRGVGAVVGVLGAMVFLAASVRADQPMQPAAPAQNAPAPAKAPATNAPAAVPPDAFGQYGKIVTPSDQLAHPLKLKLPFPGVGEVRIPTQDELNVREKLEELAKLSDDEIRVDLEKWPAYSKMSLRDQGLMLQRIQDLRDYRSAVAKGKAHDMGLLTLTPDQQAKFEKDYWDQRLAMDHDLAKQFEPIFKAREQKMRDELFRAYSALPAGPVAEAPKPPAPTPKPAAPVSNPAPTAPGNPPNKTSATVPAKAPTMPVAQAPH